MYYQYLSDCFIVYLRTVDEDAERRLKLKPGQKVCQFCYEKEPSQSEQEQRSSTDDDAYDMNHLMQHRSPLKPAPHY